MFAFGEDLVGYVDKRKQRYATDPKYREAQKAYERRKRQLRWEMALSHLGHQCWKCGTEEDLEFDHIVPRTKSFSLLNGSGLGRSLHDWMRELDKCQTICKTCHEAKTSKENIVHGSGKRYQLGCRCRRCETLGKKVYMGWKRGQGR